MERRKAQRKAIQLIQNICGVVKIAFKTPVKWHLAS